MIIPTNVSYYVKVPKDIITTLDVNSHRIDIYIFLAINRTLQHKVNYSPIYMIENCGYIPKWYRGKNRDNIYTKFRDCMIWLYENKYLENFNVEDYVQSKYQASLLNMSKFNPSGNYGILYDFEIDAINHYHSSYRSLTHGVLLLLLSFIKAYMWTRITSNSGHSEKSKREKPEVLSITYKDIAAITGISPVLVSKSTEVLTNLGLIRTYRDFCYQDQKGIWHTSDILYLIPYKFQFTDNGIIQQSDYDWNRELQYGIDFFTKHHNEDKKFYQD